MGGAIGQHKLPGHPTWTYARCRVTAYPATGSLRPAVALWHAEGAAAPPVQCSIEPCPPWPTWCEALGGRVQGSSAGSHRVIIT